MAPTMTPELRGLVALNLLPRVGPRTTTALLERFGSAEAALRASVDQWREIPHVGEKTATDIYQAIRRLDVDKELELIETAGIRLVMRGMPEYPAGFTDLPDAPHLLYLRGEIKPGDAKAIGIVGSRHCTAYGRRAAERLATELAGRGYTIVSGLARGIDGVAHRAALKQGGRTLAVLAGGLSKIYPPEHAELADEVAHAGAILTEAPMTMQPLPGMFPIRNRIISGLSVAVIVVEAAEQSGALSTASHAAEQGRPVFAVPGPVDSAASGGTNRLIREGAVLVRHVEDVLEELEGIRTVHPPALSEPPPGLNDLQRSIWAYLAEQPRHVDEMTRQLGQPISELTGALMLMEMKKVIRRLPGNLYERR